MRASKNLRDISVRTAGMVRVTVRLYVELRESVASRTCATHDVSKSEPNCFCAENAVDR